MFKLTIALGLCLILGAVASAQTTVDLIAGQNDDAGDVTIWNDADYLYVKYETVADVFIEETHVHVATPLEGIPQANGNPIPGQFDYQTFHDPWVTEFTYMIPLDPGWVSGTELYIAAHAVVYIDDGFGGYYSETAWGDGYGFPGSNWATYILYTVGCNSPVTDAQVNGQDSNVVIPEGDNVKIDIEVECCGLGGVPVDIWVLIKNASGVKRSYANGRWYQGWCTEYYTGPCIDITDTVLDRPLPVGSYKVCLAIDSMPNGDLNVPYIVSYDCVEFTVVP